MKRIDRLLIQSFIPPFIATFFIALFVLIMQFLWTYIDDIIGKGASLLIILELLSYLTMSLIPTALPIAVLISSVMVMGNLAERYELASIKSAGVPLLRIMRPLIWFTAGISIFSFFCSNNVIPLANLQFKSRLYDIRKQKPTLSLEEGVFNEDFKDFIIHIGYKNPENNRQIGDVMIYDHSAKDRKPLRILAESGEMYATADGRYFVMNLFNGAQYQETNQGTGKDRKYPFVRTTFKEWKKVLDLSEFQINRTDTDLLDSHHSMLSVTQLRAQIDSLENKYTRKLDQLTSHTNQYIMPFRKADLLLKDSLTASAQSDTTKVENQTKQDSSKIGKTIPANFASSELKHQESQRKRFRKPLPQKEYTSLEGYTSIRDLFMVEDLKGTLFSRAQSFARNLHSQAISVKRNVDKDREKRVKHIYELHLKFSMALICVIFLFIGAPMGAIVRKGGFGYPILVAIFFFMLYIVLNIFCKKLAESFVLSAVMASWIPCFILFPLGLFLTFRAMNDSKLFDADRVVRFLHRIIVRRYTIFKRDSDT